LVEQGFEIKYNIVFIMAGGPGGLPVFFVYIKKPCH